eukprot:PITA_05855
MKDGDSVTEHLNAFNIVVSQLLSIDIKISNEDKCVSFLCSLPDSGDNLVIAIGSNTTALQFDEIVSSLLTGEMRRKNMNGDALSVEGRSQNRNKNKSSSGRYKSRGRSKSPGKSIKAKTTSYEGGDVYYASSSTHVDHEAWLIDLGASFHFTPHREWFCEYEKYDGGDVFLGDDRKARIVGRGKVKLKLQGGRVRTLPSVLHIHALARNLISVSKLDDVGVKTVFKKDACKMNRVSFPSGGKRANHILELVHSDVFGPVKVPSLSKSIYYVSFINDFSRNTGIYFLKKKSEVFDRSPSLALEDKTPQEVWTGKKPSLSHLRVFGCDAYVHVPKEKQTKLDSKSKKCILIGYKDGLKGDKLWNPITRKVVYNRDVVLREVKDVIKHEVQQKEPEKIEFELKEEESDSTAEEESEDEES